MPEPTAPATRPAEAAATRTVALLRDRIAALGMDAVLLSAPHELRWAVGFTGSNGLLLVTASDARFVTDGRYAEQAEREVRGASVHVPGYDLAGHLAANGHLRSGARVAVSADVLTVAALADLRERFSEVTFLPVLALLDAMMAVKTDEEIERIESAQRITEAVFEEILGRIRPGVTEREIAAAIAYEHLRRGAERMAFEPIVGSGPNGARPHARAGDRALAPGDLVVIDMGGVVEGYASDMTRTVALGEPSEEARAVYEVVRAAQRAAIDAARAGIASSALDGVARGVIDDAGYGDSFSHSLGHGIGLRTHEWPPVSYRTDAELPAGAAVTIEPGIYLPGRFGVRIENIVVLREDGCRDLTRTDTALLVLPA